MGRLRRQLQDNNNFEGYSSDERYNLAYKRVKRIKGFYIHFLVYILVNAFIIFSSYNHNVNKPQEFWNWETFSTALFWGIGIVAHASSVFGKDIFFGDNWEERKIKEFMEKDKSTKWE